MIATGPQKGGIRRVQTCGLHHSSSFFSPLRVLLDLWKQSCWRVLLSINFVPFGTVYGLRVGIVYETTRNSLHLCLQMDQMLSTIQSWPLNISTIFVHNQRAPLLPLGREKFGLHGRSSQWQTQNFDGAWAKLGIIFHYMKSSNRSRNICNKP